MTRRAWIAALWVFLAAAVQAETVTVKSGDHADFSRLVVYFGDAPDYAFERVDGGYELRPDAPVASYELGAVYDRITRARIADVATRNAGVLFLEVACACHAEVFRHAGNLVIDVKDGAEEPDPAPTQSARAASEVATGAPVDGPASGPVAGAETPAVQDPMPAANSLSAGNLATLPAPHRPRGSRLAWNGIDLSPPLAPRPPYAPSPAAQSGAATANDLAATRAALAAQIARAAAEGLVEAAPVARLTPPADAPARSDAAAAARDVPPGASKPNIRIETAFDRGELPSRPPEVLDETGEACLPDAFFDVASWGEPPDRGAGIAGYRANLVGEFDAADPESLTALARHYIYLTFGAEANSLIGGFSGRIARADVLIMLAEIMDNGESAAYPAIFGQVTCDSAAALWAILAKPQLSRGDQVSVTAVLTAFSALPLHLRRHLGPALAQRFLQVDDTNTAATIRNSIVRAPGEHGAGVALMEAEIALELGDRDEGEASLSQVVKNGGPLTADAVLALLDARLEAGAIPDPELVASAEALAYEARGTETGAALAEARLRALAHRGEVVRALAELAGAIAEHDLSDAAVRTVRREALDLASRDAADAVFLQAALIGPPNLGRGAAAAETRHRVARRLVDLGFFDAARNVLGEERGVPGPKSRLLYAESFLGEGRADLAIGYLAGLQDVEALQLLARAHAQAGEFARAEALFAELGAEDARAQTAWRALDLETVRQIGSAEQRAAAEMAVAPAPDGTGATDAPVTLAESARALEQSRQTRDVLATLLASIAQP